MKVLTPGHKYHLEHFENGDKEEAQLAPAPEEAVTEKNTKVSVKEPAPEYRELGPDEVPQVGDEWYSNIGKRWNTSVASSGEKVSSFKNIRFRTRRSLSKQKEETPLDLDIEVIEEVANHPLEPRVDFYTRQLAAHSAHAIRYLRDEIQKLKQK